MIKSQHKTIVIADDEDTLRTNLTEVLREEGFTVIACADGTAALSALKDHTVDALITDLRMPGICGMDLIQHATKVSPEASIIVVTAFGQVETAVDAMKMGARDYLCKPIIFDELIFKLKRLLAHKSLEKENKMLREQIHKTHAAEGIVGESPVMQELKRVVERISHTRSNVLINGESGTGKEVLAWAIHHSGATRDHPFIPVNCGGLTESLIESELFGYKKGAFTGADKDHIGSFEAADGGTLFLDEIGNLPMQSQSVLLRAIQQRAITRVGDNRIRPVHIRIIAATNRELEASIREGTFREDLFYRLNVIRINAPPLRERREDIPALITHFVAKYNKELNGHCEGFDDEAMAIMCQCPWRGNVRELENVVERALIFADGRMVQPKDLSISMETPTTTSNPRYAKDLRSATHEFERQHIERALAECPNKALTAERLGIGLSSLYRKIEELGIGKAPVHNVQAARWRDHRHANAARTSETDSA